MKDGHSRVSHIVVISANGYTTEGGHRYAEVEAFMGFWLTVVKPTINKKSDGSAAAIPISTKQGKAIVSVVESATQATVILSLHRWRSLYIVRWGTSNISGINKRGEGHTTYSLEQASVVQNRQVLVVTDVLSGGNGNGLFFTSPRCLLY